jgi:hypothetical protein
MRTPGADGFRLGLALENAHHGIDLEVHELHSLVSPVAQAHLA